MCKFSVRKISVFVKKKKNYEAQKAPAVIARAFLIIHLNNWSRRGLSL